MTDLETRNAPADPADTLDAATAAVEELRSAAEQHRAQLDERLATETRALNDRLAAIETRLNRPVPAAPRNPNEPSPEVRAFNSYLRMGDRAPTDEIRTLVVASDPQGGYLAPDEMSREMIRNLVQFSPIRSLASVRTTGSPSVIYPKRTSITNAAWKGEAQAQTESEPGFGQTEVTIKELNTYVDISNQLLSDSGGMAETEVRLALAEDFGQKEGLAFVKGDGVLQPEGLLTAAGVAYIASGNASTLGSAPADLLISALYSLPAPYRSKSTWLMNGTTLAALRSLKDSTGRYLWQPALTENTPETLLGRPVVEVVDMDDVGAGAFPIMLGDFATAFRIVDRVSMSILVNPYVLATQGITRIHATRRVGARMIQSAAVKKIKVAVS